MAGFGPGNILIKIGAEGAQAIAEIEKVNGAMATSATRSERMGAALKRASVPATIALGAIAYGAKKAIDSAAELEKQVHKTEAVFKQNAVSVEDWSKTLAHSFGLSEGEALTMANKFGQLFRNLGYSSKQSAQMSEKMTQLASDMASFNDVPVDETMKALQSGMAGATRGLKKFGIVIDQNKLKQDAMRDGLYHGKGALDAHTKSLETMKEIMKQTSVAQGDFAKHASDSSNAQKIQAAETQNLKEELGKGLLPYYEQMMKILVSVTGEMGKHTTSVKVAIGLVAGLSGAIIIANAAFKAWTIATKVAAAASKAFAAAQWLLNAALDANPIGAIIIALIALGAGLVIAYKKSQTFRDIVHAAMGVVSDAIHAMGRAFSAVKDIAISVFDWVKDHWKLALFAFGPLGAGIYALVTNFQKVREAAGNVFDAVKRIVGGAIDALVAAFNRIKTVGVAVFNAIMDPIHAVEHAINAVIGAVRDLISWIGKIHIPHISLPHIPGLSASLIVPAAAGSASGLARAGGGAPAVGARAALATGGAGGGITVNFYGPTDPEGAARAIARVLRSHEIRQGRARGLLSP